MTDARPPASDESERRLDELEARVAAIRADIDALLQRADQSNSRANDAEARATEHSTRLDAFEARLDVDREVMARLQADGLINDEHAAHLTHALHSSRRIGAAMGIIMAARKVSEQQAFELLSRGSQYSNRKLHVLAEDIVVKGDVTGLPEA